MSGRKVLIAVDESDNSKFAFQWYSENVYREGDEIYLCHIPEVPKLPTFTFKGGLTLPADEWAKSIEEVQKKSAKLQDEYDFQLRNKNITKFCYVGNHNNNKGKGIIEAVDESKADLLVMGTRRLDAVNRAFRGSVSDYVVHHCNTPMMIVPMKK